MIEAFPADQTARRAMLLEAAAGIADTLQASGPKSEELGTLAPEAVTALRESGMFRLKLVHEMGGAEADPVTEMLVLENLAYNDMTSGWCTMVGATAIASLGTFLTPEGLAHVFQNGYVPTASISFFPAGRAKRDGKGYRLSGRWRFNSGIRHAEWVVGGTVIEDAKPGEPAVMFSAMPAMDVTLYDNWGGVVGLRGTGSVDCSVENHFLPQELSFVWDLLHPAPARGGPGYLIPPFAYVAKEHGSVAVGAARRALDELIKIATSTRGTFRSSKLDERQVVHRFIAEADLKLRAARALMHERYDALYDKVLAGHKPDGADIADVRAICVYATDVAIWVATNCYHFAGNTGLHHPNVIGRLLRDLNTAGIHQVMSDTAYENHGQFKLGLPTANPLA
jgi:alkylation response protein AidB-like acyl-CoA dehydrogenase